MDAKVDGIREVWSCRLGAGLRSVEILAVMMELAAFVFTVWHLLCCTGPQAWWGLVDTICAGLLHISLGTHWPRVWPWGLTIPFLTCPYLKGRFSRRLICTLPGTLDTTTTEDKCASYFGCQVMTWHWCYWSHDSSTFGSEPKQTHAYIHKNELIAPNREWWKKDRWKLIESRFSSLLNLSRGEMHMGYPM